MTVLMAYAMCLTAPALPPKVLPEPVPGYDWMAPSKRAPAIPRCSRARPR